MSNNCMTCRHRSHDAERLPVCEKVYGGYACQHCHAIPPNDFTHAVGGMLCKSCGSHQSHMIKNDWREGYLGQPVDGHLTPLPCCPGWESEPVVASPKVERQRGLFD